MTKQEIQAGFEPAISRKDSEISPAEPFDSAAGFWYARTPKWAIAMALRSYLRKRRTNTNWLDNAKELTRQAIAEVREHENKRKGIT
jgi:hypothetical protein